MSEHGEPEQPRHGADMDWLYRHGDAQATPEPTAIMPHEPPRHAMPPQPPQDAPPVNDPAVTPTVGQPPYPPGGTYGAYPPQAPPSGFSQTPPSGSMPGYLNQVPPAQPNQAPPAQPNQAPPAQAAPQPSAYSRPRSPGMTVAAPHRQRRRRRRRHPLRWVAWVLVLALVWFLGVPALALARSSTVDSTPQGNRPAAQPGTAILLVGSDSRDGLSAEDRAKYGVGAAEGNRTDTMMILYVPPTGAAALISLPRDSYVDIPGHGKNKLNAAFAFGGAPLLVQTVEQTTGLRMDGYLSVGLIGFAKMVDAVDGIEVCLDKPMKDADSGANFPAGCQTLNGTQALSYVRMRKADPRGDLGRIQRQREVIGQVADKVLSPGTLLNPVRYWSVCMAAGQALTRGSNTGPGVLFTTLKGFSQVGNGTGLTGTVPISNPGASTPAGSSVIWNDAEAKKMFALLASGTTEGLEKYLK